MAINQKQIIAELARNASVFEGLLTDTDSEAASWKPAANKWSLLEVVCHLHDEECEDFRERLKSCLENPEHPLLPIDPESWVEIREYIEQDFDKKLQAFLKEREKSVNWLSSLEDPKWDNAVNHPTLDKLTANQLLANWLAHDHIHIRQINRVKYQYLYNHTDESLDYAGDW